MTEPASIFTTLPKKPWKLTKDKHPPEGDLVLGSNGRGYVLVVWHGAMGYDGDFATVKKMKRTINVEHCEGITMWCELPKLPEVMESGDSK